MYMRHSASITEASNRHFSNITQMSQTIQHHFLGPRQTVLVPVSIQHYACKNKTNTGSQRQQPPPHTTTVLRPFFRDHPGEPVPEENFWTLWCKERLTEADTPTIWLGATPSRLTSAHLHHPPYFLRAGCPSCHPTNSVKALKAL